jgi:hypothetical protein
MSGRDRLPDFAAEVGRKIEWLKNAPGFKSGYHVAQVHRTKCSLASSPTLSSYCLLSGPRREKSSSPSVLPIPSVMTLIPMSFLAPGTDTL